MRSLILSLCGVLSFFFFFNYNFFFFFFFLISGLLAISYPLVKPVLNWANVSSPEHTSDTSTNYDSFLT